MTNLKTALKHTFNLRNIVKEVTTLDRNDYMLLSVLCLAQVATFFIAGSYSIMSLTSLLVGVVTIFNVILVNRGRITNYFYGTIATIFWLAIALQSMLIGDVFSQLFYLIMQFVGLYFWQKQMNATDTSEVVPKKITLGKAVIAILGFIFIYVIVLSTSHHLGGQQIWLDSTLLPLAIISQILMTGGYRTQWIGWILIDAINVIIWYNVLMTTGASVAGMFILQLLMLINAFYGAWLWFKPKKSICDKKGHDFEIYQFRTSAYPTDIEKAGHCKVCGYDTHDTL